MAERVQPDTKTTGGDITALFHEAGRAATRNDDQPSQPSGKRRKGEDDKESGRNVRRYPFRRASRRNGGQAWRIARTAFKNAKPMIAVRAEPPFDPITEAIANLADTLDWMNEYGGDFATDINADYGAQSVQSFPQLQL